MNIKNLKKELKNAGNGWRRAAFGSIVRRNYDEIRRMNRGERKQLIKTLGFTEAYETEMSKELKGIEYDQRHSRR